MDIKTQHQRRDPSIARAQAVDAVLLAAGRGVRMGGPNKLLADLAGKPLVRHALDALKASGVRDIIAVLGHQSDQMKMALSGTATRLVENPDYLSGLASSLKAGINALPADTAGALVALGDMPYITSHDIDRLIAAFAIAQGHAVVRASHHGKRGNPLILPRSLFSATASLTGDIGARHLIETSGIAIIDVEIGKGAGMDIDTPQGLAAARSDQASPPAISPARFSKN